ncbi:hypothetical protein GCM10028827_29170 [Mucilaginibacter myungsuensis]|nr:c-type cytochrome [Mucilaginibacter myungsuensis]
MKFKFRALLFTIAFTAISGVMYTASAQTKKAPAKKAPAGKSSAADIAAGQDLISKSDCLTCHKLDVKIIGPAYKDVAAKYKPTDANVALLAKKVLEGGSGVWGAVPMSAHPNLSTADAKKMVRYILSVK